MLRVVGTLLVIPGCTLTYLTMVIAWHEAEPVCAMLFSRIMPPESTKFHTIVTGKLELSFLFRTHFSSILYDPVARCPGWRITSPSNHGGRDTPPSYIHTCLVTAVQSAVLLILDHVPMPIQGNPTLRSFGRGGMWEKPGDVMVQGQSSAR